VKTQKKPEKPPIQPGAYRRAPAAAYLGVAESYLDKLQAKGEGPKHIKLGPRCILYRKIDLDAWLEEKLLGVDA
jgi:predicted DNA-binding transcriptional regulator AlpA